MGAFEWTAMILLFLLAESAIVTWGNGGRAKALAQIEAARPRALPPGKNNDNDKETDDG